MFSVQKRDFVGQWVELYRANMFEDAERYRKGVADGRSKVEARIIRI